MNKITSSEAFWLIMALWSLLGILAWLFHSGREYLKKANNVYQFLYRGALYGPVVLAVGIFVLVDVSLGKIKHLQIQRKTEGPSHVNTSSEV